MTTQSPSFAPVLWTLAGLLLVFVALVFLAAPARAQTPVTVSFDSSTYAAEEGGTTEVGITLSTDPLRQVVIPITTTEQGGASDADYSGVPESVTFESGETSQTFTFSATGDTIDDDDESVAISFGTLPADVTEGTTSSTTVSITDDDVPNVEVNFGADEYFVDEGSTVTVTVTLDVAPEREVVIPVTTSEQDGASDADYSGVPENVTFASGDTSKTFTFSATDDAIDDDDESVEISFGTLPADVTEGTTSSTTVSITDNDVPDVKVSFEAAEYSVNEDSTVTVTVTLDVAPEREVVIPITTTEQDGASDADYSGVPENVTFASEDTSKTFTFSASYDADADAGESVALGFGTLPASVTAGLVPSTEISIASVPVFVSAETSGSGIEVKVTFNENVAVADVLNEVSKAYGLPAADFLQFVFTVTADGKDMPLLQASLSGSVVTLRLLSPTIAAGQVVEVAYDNLFAENPGEMLTNLAGIPVPIFGPQPVTNRSGSGRRYAEAPVLSTEELRGRAGNNKKYTVALPSQPEGTVVVSILSIPSDIVWAYPESLTFNQDNWDEPQEVTMRISDEYYWMPKSLNCFWGVSMHRINPAGQSYASMVSTLITRGNPDNCSAGQELGGL